MLPVKRRDTRSRSRNRNADPALDEMFAERRGVSRASPRAGHDDARRILPQQGGKLRDRSCEHVLLALQDLGRLAGFSTHPGVRFVAWFGVREKHR